MQNKCKGARTDEGGGGQKGQIINGERTVNALREKHRCVLLISGRIASYVESRDQ